MTGVTRDPWDYRAPFLGRCFGGDKAALAALDATIAQTQHGIAGTAAGKPRPSAVRKSGSSSKRPGKSASGATSSSY